MRRRDFITLLGGAASAWPLAARGEQQPIPVIGYLSSQEPEPDAVRATSFRQGLAETSFVEGRNVAIEYRWAQEQYDRLPALAPDLVQRNVAVIFAVGNVATRVAKAATASIPIVFVTGDDPIATGLVPSLSRPGGNVTGMSMMAGTLPTKRLELLHDLIPAATTIALLVNPRNANAAGDAENVRIAAQVIGSSLIILSAAEEGELDDAFANIAQKAVSGLIVNTDTLFTSHSQKLKRIPVIWNHNLHA
jgi:putative tryptophan/tyrosine transport system substrate-binding protein